MNYKNDISVNDYNKICNYIGCNKKIKLTDFACKCKNFYCKNHKLPELHNCNYDYKKDIKKKIINELKCVSCKLQKI